MHSEAEFAHNLRPTSPVIFIVPEGLLRRFDGFARG